MDTIRPVKAGNALAATVGIAYAICAALLFLLPASVNTIIYNSIFHGIDVTSIIVAQKSFGFLFLGLVIIIVWSWLVGALFAKMYNIFTKENAV